MLHVIQRMFVTCLFWPSIWKIAFAGISDPLLPIFLLRGVIFRTSVAHSTDRAQLGFVALLIPILRACPG